MKFRHAIAVLVAAAALPSLAAAQVTVTDVEIAKPKAIDPPVCAADLNADGAADSVDLLIFLDKWFAKTADYDRSGDTDVKDLLAYLDAWFASCP